MERLLVVIKVLVVSCSICNFCCTFTYAADTIVQGQTLMDWDLLDSPNGYFRLQFFFTPEGTSKNRYLGIQLMRYGKLPLIYHMVWVANRDIPMADASGRLVIDGTGNLRVANVTGGDVIVLYKAQEATNASATLLDSGNFVLRKINPDGSTGKVLWQSFDFPTDVLLPGMKLGINYRTGHVSSLVSWASNEVPATGSFTLGVDAANHTSQLVIWWRGKIFWKSGPWLHGSFENAPNISYESNVSVTYTYISNQDEKYFMFSDMENGSYPRLRMSVLGSLMERESAASFGACIFGPSPGCVEVELPECRKKDEWFYTRKGYMSGDGLKFPNFTEYDCQQECLKNCSCMAYAPLSDDGTGCELWSKGTRFFSFDEVPSRTIYLLHKKKAMWWIMLIISLAAFLLFSSCCFLCYLARRKLKGKAAAEDEKTFFSEIGAKRADSSKSRKNKLANNANKGQDLQIFDFESILSSTNNFADENKLGEGGFGPVYKGILNGQEVAIKRLSRSSHQGVVEFKNELALVAKLQHNNLVRLIGCCIRKEEKMLVYEYMPNKSLDFFLFDLTKKSILGWKTRFNIIEGVAQGLGYLHIHSRLKIIHRDLKASNILLDSSMNPKISDFGMARIFGMNESEANTKRIVGTFGYMSPEYVMEGIFSMKSDIFSFGVLLLEIVSGKKNRRSYHPDRPLNLIGYVWELWTEGRGSELIDSAMDGDSYHSSEVLRCIHVGLLCVQENPIDRPMILDVVSKLGNENALLPTPKAPAFFTGTSSQGEIVHKSTPVNCSLNGVSISKMEPR